MSKMEFKFEHTRLTNKVYPINEFILIKIKKMLRKSQAQFREK